MEKEMIAIELGGDWHDAEVYDLGVPAGRDIEFNREERIRRFADWLAEQLVRSLATKS